MSNLLTASVPPFFPRTNPLMILPCTPVDIITTISGQAFGGAGDRGSQGPVQKSVRRRYTLRLLSSSETSDDSAPAPKGRGLRFEMTDEGDGGKEGDEDEVEEELEEVVVEENEGEEEEKVPESTAVPAADVTLYSLEVYEDDFHLLKASQSLLVDFDQFPKMLESLLRGCGTAQYQCRLTESPTGCNLQIVEPSTFKELTHLSLKIVKCNDREIRPYLANRVNELTDKLRKTKTVVEKMAKINQDAKTKSQELSNDVSRLQLEKEALARTVRLEMSEKNRESEIEMQRKMRDAVDQAKREFEAKAKEAKLEVDKMQEKLEKVVDEKDKITADRYELEGTIRSLTMDLTSRTNTCEKLTEENQEIQMKLTEAEGNRFQLEREIHRLELSVASFEQNASSTNAIEAKHEQQRVEWMDAKNSLLKQNELLAGKNEAMESKIQRAGSEIEKGNEIINKLQSEYRLVKSKLKVKTEALRSNEVSLAEREEQVSSMVRRQSSLTTDHDSLTTKHAAMITELESCKEKLAESSKLLDSNHQVITWLNKEINETQLGRVSAYGEATQSGIENKYVPSYTPELKVSKGLGAYISPEAGKY